MHRQIACCTLLAAAGLARAATDYYQHVIFDNILTHDRYFYSRGKASAPSTLNLDNDKLPIESEIFLTPPTALRLEWQSREKGGWIAEVQVNHSRNRSTEFSGDTLRFWCFSREGIAPGDLPRLVLQDSAGNFTALLDITPFSNDIHAGQWKPISIPFAAFQTASIHPFEPHRVDSVSFIQGAADGSGVVWKSFMANPEIRPMLDRIGFKPE